MQCQGQFTSNTKKGAHLTFGCQRTAGSASQSEAMTIDVGFVCA